jgi:hypothetical protein
MQTQQIHISPEEQPLIDAAITLGDRLAAMSITTAAHRRTIRAVQAALRRLPEADWTVSRDFAVDVVDDELVDWEAALLTWQASGHKGPEPACPDGMRCCWLVCLTVSTDEDGNLQRGLEIGSLYEQFPESADELLAEDGTSFERSTDEFEEEDSDGELDEEHLRWISEVLDPELFTASGQTIEIEADEWTGNPEDDAADGLLH